jgi:hypothetical protein
LAPVFIRPPRKRRRKRMTHNSSVTLRCERSEPRRATAPKSAAADLGIQDSEIGKPISVAPGPHPSRAASRPPQDERLNRIHRSRDASAPELCKTWYENCPRTRGGGAPIGAPSNDPRQRARRRVQRDALASRRSTAARPCRLAASQLSSGPRFLGLGSGAATRLALSAVQRAPRRPVVMPAGRCPELPGSGVTSPTRRHRPCSACGTSPETPLLDEQGDVLVT